MTDDRMIAALKRERAGYAGRPEMADRLAQVDEQLALRGVEPEQAERSATAQTDPPRERRTPRRQRA